MHSLQEGFLCNIGIIRCQLAMLTTGFTRVPNNALYPANEVMFPSPRKLHVTKSTAYIAVREGRRVEGMPLPSLNHPYFWLKSVILYAKAMNR